MAEIGIRLACQLPLNTIIIIIIFNATCESNVYLEDRLFQEIQVILKLFVHCLKKCCGSVKMIFKRN